MITVVVGKEIEKIKGDFESYLNGLNMVGEISYSQYSKLYDEGVKQIQRAYELGKSELEKEVKEWKDKADLWCKTSNLKDHNIMINKQLEKENAELKKDKSELCNAINEGGKACVTLNERLTEAKGLIRNLLRVTYGEGWNYSLDVKVKAEEYLKEDK